MPNVPRRIELRLTPRLLTEHLGKGAYSPARGLMELLANSIDAGATTIHVTLVFQMDTLQRLIVKDDGRGISPEALERNFAVVGEHYPDPQGVDTIGTKGIGRFAAFAIATTVEWVSFSAASTDDHLLLLRWVMNEKDPAPSGITQELIPGSETGTTVTLHVRQGDASVQEELGAIGRVKRAIFNTFAARLARRDAGLQFFVNDEPVSLEDFVLDRDEESIAATDGHPGARLQHLLVTNRVQLPAPNMLYFATHGATIYSQPLSGEAIPQRRYLGVVDSPFLSSFTNTAKTGLTTEATVQFDRLVDAAEERAAAFLSERSRQLRRTFIEKARARPWYPYRAQSTTRVGRAEQMVYDGVLNALNAALNIDAAQDRHQELIFQLTYRLLRGEEEFADVLGHLVTLNVPEVQALADVLTRTTLGSLVAVAGHVLDRLNFLDELEVLIYGTPALKVQERRQLQKIIEKHTWIFGDRYGLVTSDRSLASLFERVRAELKLDDFEADPEYIDEGIVDAELRLVPDYYLVAHRYVEPDDYFDHLIVEMKAPRVRLGPKHIDAQLRRYARRILDDPIWSSGRHRFRFVLTSASVRRDVAQMYYQADKPNGFVQAIDTPHRAELWVLPWSAFIDDRRAELNFLQSQVETLYDPEALAYLQARFPELHLDELSDDEEAQT